VSLFVFVKSCAQLVPSLDLDRSNLGNARVLSGLHDGKPALPKDALGGDPTGVLYDWVNSAFFFAYVRIMFSALMGDGL
jgi:hypothetical protein